MLLTERFIAQSTPEYEWSRIPNATNYRLVVNDSTGGRIRELVSADTAGCVQPGQTCKYRFDTSVSGSVNWFVRSYNLQGFGPWSSAGNFRVQ